MASWKRRLVRAEGGPLIFLGFSDIEKNAEIARYCAGRAISKIVIISPEKFRLTVAELEHEHILWDDVIKYTVYYRLLQEIDRDTMVVINECLRSQNRHELSYNCIRLFLQQTEHRLVFQYLPLIDTQEDFMILFDFDTQSRWKREPFRAELLREVEVRTATVPIELRAIPVETDAKLRAAYAREKRVLLDGLGLKDPHTVPRNLYLMSGKAKLPSVATGAAYVGRNNRFGLPNLATYREAAYGAAPYTVFELPHSFLDFADFLALSRQTQLDVLVADLKVDRWYLDRYQQWLGRIRDAQAVVRGETNRP
jgi:hypothetical protein